MKIIKKITHFFKALQYIKYLDENCMSLKIGTPDRNLIGHWECDGDVCQTIDEIKDRTSTVTTKVK